MREDTLPALEKDVQSECDLVHIEARDPFEDENPPVTLDNPPLATPFESVTEVYGMPRPGTIDPSFASMPFSSYFFGMALGDGEYGIFSALCVFFYSKNQDGRDGKKAFLLDDDMWGTCVLVGALNRFMVRRPFGIAPVCSVLWMIPCSLLGVLCVGAHSASMLAWHKLHIMSNRVI